MLVRDERPWGSRAPPAVVYRYSTDRRGEHARALLDTCRGFLHADGDAGFNELYAPDPMTHQPRLHEVACWAHARRKIYEVELATGSAIAKGALQRIAALFAIEAGINRRQRACRYRL